MKRLFIAILFFIPVTFISACPFCGCGNSNFQIGVLPTFSKAFVGVRYTYSEFNSQSKTDITQHGRDYFHTTEVWGGYQLGKVQLMAFIPYVNIHKTGDDGVVDSQGLGDVIFLSNYKILSSKITNSKSKKTFTNNLWLGAGIKLKTGKSHVDLVNPDFTVGDFGATPGTGSTDFLINTSHNVLWRNNGIVTNVTYRANTKNDQEFKYGNRIYINSAFFHSWPVGLVTVRPSVGLNLIMNGSNRYQSQDVTGSSGCIFSGLAGVNLQKGKLGLLLNGFLPIAQDIYNGQTKFITRISAAFTYSF